jgi:hypothetical protein
MLMQDQVTPLASRYGMEIAVMKEMTWSWSDLQAAPLDLVEELAVRLAEREKWTAKRQQLDRDMNR